VGTTAASFDSAILHRRRRACTSFVASLLLAACNALASGIDASVVVAQVDSGQFHAAEAAIAQFLARTDVDAATRRDLEFQRERMRRILLDFTLDSDAVKARLRRDIPDLRDSEFADWDARGLIERQVIDGRVLYFKRAPSNLFRLGADARARRAVAATPTDGPMEVANAHHREVVDAARRTHSTSVAPRRLEVTQSLTVNADAVPAGETVRAWIPYPRALAGQQEGIRFLASEPARHAIAPESALQRTVYLEKPAVAGKPTVFSSRYELTVFARRHPVGEGNLPRTDITPALAPFVSEQPPHIVFNQAIRLFSRQVLGDEKDPWRITQKLYAAVDQIPWAGAREYSTIANISDYALHAGHADCGQQTLLLITLLRLNGIPARWQSGMVYSDGEYSNLHDWGQLWVAPLGWIPMDVTTGRLDSKDADIAGFYLGGIDAYRIAFNDDIGGDFMPPKAHFRSDTVDSQRGEAEWRGGNLYFDQWDYGFEWQVLAGSSETAAHE
jgi:transglutaminase-like putative cysteine protease